MRHIATAIIALVVAVVLSTPARAADYIAMTSPLPPYSISKGLHVHGISVDVLAMMMTLAGSPVSSFFFPTPPKREKNKKIFFYK